MPSLDVKVISVAVLCEAPRNGSFVRFQSPGATEHTLAGADDCCFIRQWEGSALSHGSSMFVFHISPGVLALMCESLGHNSHKSSVTIKRG